jgi:hypothetical protein
LLRCPGCSHRFPAFWLLIAVYVLIVLPPIVYALRPLLHRGEPPIHVRHNSLRQEEPLEK